MNCQTVRERLSEWIDGEVSAEEAPAFASHLAGCPACHMEEGALRRASEAVRSLPRLRVPAGFNLALRERLARASLLAEGELVARRTHIRRKLSWNNKLGLVAATMLVAVAGHHLLSPSEQGPDKNKSQIDQPVPQAPSEFSRKISSGIDPAGEPVADAAERLSPKSSDAFGEAAGAGAPVVPSVREVRFLLSDPDLLSPAHVLEMASELGIRIHSDEQVETRARSLDRELKKEEPALSEAMTAMTAKGKAKDEGGDRTELGKEWTLEMELTEAELRDLVEALEDLATLSATDAPRLAGVAAEEEKGEPGVRFRIRFVFERREPE